MFCGIIFICITQIYKFFAQNSKTRNLFLYQLDTNEIEFNSVILIIIIIDFVDIGTFGWKQFHLLVLKSILLLDCRVFY